MSNKNYKELIVNGKVWAVYDFNEIDEGAYHVFLNVRIDKKTSGNYRMSEQILEEIITSMIAIEEDLKLVARLSYLNI